MENRRRRLEKQPVEEERDVPDAETVAFDVAGMPGFRFQPTEEELVGFYLRSAVAGKRLQVELINVVNVFRHDPWELPAMALLQGEREWVFYCPDDCKVPCGALGSLVRVTASGYWKYTGRDHVLRRSRDARSIGTKKTLAFYAGRAPSGRKTEWIMYEYRMPAAGHDHRKCPFRKDPIVDVALCLIHKKHVNHDFKSAHQPYPHAECSKCKEGDHALESGERSASSGTSAKRGRGSSLFEDSLPRGRGSSLFLDDINRGSDK